jgi:hypothetical protein
VMRGVPRLRSPKPLPAVASTRLLCLFEYSTNPNMTAAKRENFERAFTSGGGGCRKTCECGKEFYNPDDSWDWDDGELDELYADPDAVSLPHTVGTLIVGGTEYVCDCDCWLPQAVKMMAWLDANAYQIAEYLSLERERKTAEAERAPLVRHNAIGEAQPPAKRL